MKPQQAISLTTLMLCALAQAAMADDDSWTRPQAGPRLGAERGIGTGGKTDATAEPRRHPPLPPILAALDANSDGVIDADEIANAAAALRTLDADGDGRLAQEEIRPPRPQGAPGGMPGERRGGPGCRHDGPPPEEGGGSVN